MKPEEARARVEAAEVVMLRRRSHLYVLGYLRAILCDGRPVTVEDYERAIAEEDLAHE